MPKIYSNLSDFYHPIIITKEQQNYFKENKLNLTIGDVLPFSIETCFNVVSHVKIENKFVIAGIIDYGTDTFTDKISLDNCFPAIIKTDDYISCINNSGLRNNDINEALYSIATDYIEYCEKHNLTCKLKPEAFDFHNLISYSNFNSKFNNSITYYGNKNLEEDFILLPKYKNYYDDLLNKFSYSNDFDSRVDKDFFANYLDYNVLRYQLKSTTPLFKSIDVSSFVISGLFEVDDDSIDLKDCIIVSDSLYSKLISKIKESHYKEGIFVTKIFGNKKYIKDNFDYLYTHKEFIVSASWENCVNSLNN